MTTPVYSVFSSAKAKWLLVIVGFFCIAFLDFMTPSEYIWAYLYVLPMLVSVSFLEPELSKKLLFVAVAATLLNLVYPENVLINAPVVINRLLAVLAITVSAYFMVRHIRHLKHSQEQESLLATQQRLAQVREDFIATLTHDLKTPLLGEQQALNYFSTGAFGHLTSEQLEVISVLKRSNQRQLDLVQTLVKTYQNDNIGVDLQLVLIDIDELLADALIEMQFLATERDIAFDYQCEKTPPLIKGDPLQLKRVFINLLHNALNYSPAKSCITISVFAYKDALVVTVADEGPGIAAGDLENVFKRFYQSGADRQVIGTGLGLYFSRQIVMAHRGQIKVGNRLPKGCCFTVILPIALNDNEGL